MDTSRRALLATAAPAALLPSTALAKERDEDKDDVPPVEDLMREHGVIRRDLEVYDELASRIEAAAAPPSADTLTAAVELMRHFAEGYHEKLEETQLFPRLEKKGLLVPLCATLRAQHAVGRNLNQEILTLAKSWGEQPKRLEVAKRLRAFTRMYRPHAAREDTEAFIAFRKLLPPKELDALGDQFEDQEHELLGANGFEKALAEVERLEKALDIADLGHFTAR